MTSPPTQPAYIDGDLLRSLVPMPDAIEASRRAFAAALSGELTGSLRSSLSRNRVLVMPVEHASGSALIKVINPNQKDSQLGLPSLGGTVIWIDSASGQVTALLDAAALTALRTGAASGLATELLAPAASSVLALLGAGGQAADQVAAVCAVRPITEVRVFSRNSERRDRLCTRLAALHPGISFLPAASSRAAVRGAQVICTATRSEAPLFEASDLAAEVHINAIGAYKAEMCEIPAAALAQATLVTIDDLEAVMAEAGDLIQAIEAGQLRRDSLVEIGRLLATPVTPPGGLTVFKSVGIAAQDWALGELVVRRARENGVMPGEAVGAALLSCAGSPSSAPAWSA